MSRRLLMGFGGVLLVGGCASTGGGDRTAAAGATRPAGAGSATGTASGAASGTQAGPDPRSRPTTGGGAPSTSTGTTTAGDPAAGSSSAPSTSHSSSSSSAPPHTQGPPTAKLPNDPPPAAGKPQFYVHEGDKAIALTIDDGPSSAYTPQVLAVLARYNIRATFCMIGENARQHASLVAEVSAAGHMVANHTYSHADMARMTAAQVRAEIERANDAITAGGAERPALFRSPGGNWSPTVFQVCSQMGMRPLDWSVDPRDWSRPGTDHIVQTVMGHTHTGSIILEHDGGGDRSQTVAALKRFLPRLIDAGYRFVQP